MGTVKLNSGSVVEITDLEGNVTLHDIYHDVLNDQYTEAYRKKIIGVWGKLERHGWAILPVLHDLVKGTNAELASEAALAIKLIDPGAPTLSKDIATTYSTPHSKKTTPAGKPTESTPAKDNRFQIQNGHTLLWKTLERKKVTLTEIDTKNDLSEGTRVNGTCCFCDKAVLFTNTQRSMSDFMSGSKRLYCTFCLRNEYFKLKHRKNTLLMSFRGIIAYYYYSFYLVPKTSSMYLHDLEGYINLHIKVGTQNPLFRYDPESFLWFVDFSKVGNKPSQVPLSCVLETVVDILASFDLYNNVKECSPSAFFQKFREAMYDFHHHRRRPSNQRILTPTLYGTGIPHESGLSKAIPINLIKGFSSCNLIESHKRSYSGCG